MNIDYACKEKVVYKINYFMKKITLILKNYIKKYLKAEFSKTITDDIKDDISYILKGKIH